MADACELLRNTPSPIHVLLNDYERLLLEKSLLDKYEDCIKALGNLLSCTGHVARARTIAYMAGFCRYLARLVEGYGVSIAFSGITPGKGSIAHKLLAIATQLLAERYGFDTYPGKDAIAEAVEAAEKALEEAGELEPLSEVKTSESEKEVLPKQIRKQLEEVEKEYAEKRREAREAAIEILNNLYMNLGAIASTLNIDLSKLRPLTEIQLIDYAFHIIGTPDLILEDPDSRRAIVVEWKTYVPKSGSPTPSPWEWMQAYVYALLELRRLGYGGRTMTSAALHERFVKAFTETDPGKTSVYPLVVHINGIYSKHPAKPSKRVSPETDLCQLYRLLVISALHLVSLLAYDKNAYQLCRVSSKELGLEELIGEKDITLYRLTPPTLSRSKTTYTGRPAVYEKYPCKVCLKMFKQAALACKKYFKDGLDSKLSRAFYSMRNEILERHANSMQIYRLLYMLRPAQLFEAEKERRPYVLRDCNVIEAKGAGSLGSGAGIPALIVGGTAYRYNFFDRLEIKYRTVNHKDYVIPIDIIDIKLIRGDTESLEETAEGLEDIDVSYLPAIREGKPVAVYFIENEERPITLNLGFFARVDKVDYIVDESGKSYLVVSLGLPSASLKFGILLLYWMLPRLGCRREESPEDGEDVVRVVCNLESENGLPRLLASEVMVDLSRYDLRTLDLLYRALEEAKEYGDVSSEDIKDVESELQKTINKLFKELYYGLVSE